MKQSAVKNSPEDFDFIVTTGDNLRPKNNTQPTNREVDNMLDLFRKQKTLNNTKIFAVRGNHGANFHD